jgi:hypothetical protein
MMESGSPSSARTSEESASSGRPATTKSLSVSQRLPSRPGESPTHAKLRANAARGKRDREITP